MTPHAELRMLAEAATPGPWVHWFEEGPWGDGNEVVVRKAHATSTLANLNRHENAAANAAYIAAANPTRILALLTETERLTARVARLEGATKEALSAAVAMHSLLERAAQDRCRPQVAVASDRMFEIMMQDHARHIENARAALAPEPTTSQETPA